MSGAFTRTPVIVWSERTDTGPAETYGFAGSAGVVIEGQLLRGETASDTVYVFMHPTTTLHLLPLPEAMAAAGRHVLCAASRYPKNDSTLIMEKAVLDLGRWVRWAREEAGYRRVVLMGWSGGGSLALFYQAEAERPSVTSTPAGDPVSTVDAGLVPADGLVLVAAHLSRAETLTEWMDPSVLDEAQPGNRRPDLDIYAADPVHRPPYDAGFVAEFRAAQQDRNHRITAWVREQLATLQAAGGPEAERPFLVHRTMCDVRWLDPAVDPNDRRPDWCYLGDPRAANVGPLGLARFSTLRSWLSQWSLEASRAKGAENASRVARTPVLQIENTADDAVPATHGRIVQTALATPDKEYEQIAGATHYYKGQPEHLTRCLDLITDWCTRHDLADQ
ncbi:alpha/beta hydrolase [Pseudonocardia sulfidoxydans NBRC 16205]|uniref:Alpha/beta hydrolase n=1 Tax=Pseudonocardia sulfidoxydans NBRC 16205 TaxID=1223511 RepID=A0A511DA35_9PSEU|nr:alpha/beta hydrolase [Pseudonocardia sulfidoxydans]GEL21243.1 alpha/beta hydrolase [Pseudonocardia sulfidoxydans NBRC 16205]